MSRLFIIGNGFDLAHGEPTAYRDFRDWMVAQLMQYGISGDELESVPVIPFSSLGNREVEFNRTEVLTFLMWLLQYGSDIDDEWNEFESALYNLDLQTVMDENTMFVRSPDNEHEDEWPREAQDMEMYAEALREALLLIGDLFAEWIRSIKLNERKIAFGWDVICDGSDSWKRTDDLFLTFNYTETLESLYKVSDCQICHIHGARTLRTPLIIGHGVDEARNFDTEYLSVADILESAIQSLRKDTNTIIQDNRSFFEKIRRSDITEVYCFGFSFSEVDLPYVNKIVKCLKRSGEAVTWKFNSYSREKNEAYKNVVIQCGFSGTFSEFEASKILIDSDILLPAVLDSFDREETWKFYYDESNFFGKLKMKEDAAGKNVFNVDTDKDFVLAGLVVEPNCEVPDSSQLWKKLHLPCQITELKFTRQFSEGDFLQTIGKSRVYSLLEFIDQSGYFIHVAHINSFYYAVVDIVDSVIELEDIIEYRGDADVDLRYELNNFKSQLYEILHTKRQAVEKLFSDYSYPDIEPECVEDFCNELTLLFGRRNDLSMDMKFLTGMIRKAGSSGELLFLQGNQKRVMIENLTQFYCHFVFLFQKSEHIFDDQKEIRREMERYEFIGSDSKILQNYAFVDSKNDLMIQISDVISGLFGQLFAYLNMTSEYKIRNDVRNMSEAKRKTVALLYKLVMKSEQKNKGFIFSIAPYAVRKKFNLLRG